MGPGFFYRRRRLDRRMLVRALALSVVVGLLTLVITAAVQMRPLLASLATVNGKEYILVTLAAPGDHGTEQYNIRDAVHVYRKLADKK